MPKPERVVVAGLPHHLTHRGNRREEIFRETEDFKTYLGCSIRLHGQYAEFFNARYGLVGHLWQGRFRSSVMDEHHLLNGVRYVERNPVRAGLVQRAEDYPWSSAAAHCGLRQDPLISDDLPLLRDVPDWSSWLAGVESDEELRRMRECAERCYPVGSEAFVRRIEEQSGCRFPARNGNRKSKKGDEGAAPSSPMLNLKFSER
jgi:REP-associated tyrosine transposase